MSKKNKKLEPPPPPAQPITPYMRFSNSVWVSIREDNPELRFGEIAKLISKSWKNMADDEKQKFFDEHALEKVEYQSAKEKYQKSSAYQAYLKAIEQRKRQEEQVIKKAATGKKVTRSNRIYSRV